MKFRTYARQTGLWYLLDIDAKTIKSVSFYVRRILIYRFYITCKHQLLNTIILHNLLYVRILVYNGVLIMGKQVVHDITL